MVAADDGSSQETGEQASSEPLISLSAEDEAAAAAGAATPPPPPQLTLDEAKKLIRASGESFEVEVFRLEIKPLAARLGQHDLDRALVLARLLDVRAPLLAAEALPELEPRPDALEVGRSASPKKPKGASPPKPRPPPESAPKRTGGGFARRASKR